jgi:hypothetical protein
MLTVFAWMVFIPAVFWNVTILCVAFADLMSTKPGVDWSNKRNFRDLILSLMVLFIPGVYLFGLF